MLKRDKILFASHTGVFSGGAEKSLLLLAEQIKTRYDVIINIPDNNKELMEEIKKKKIKFVNIVKDIDKTEFNNLTIFSKILKVFRRVKYIINLIIFIKRNNISVIYCNTLRTTSELVAGFLTKTNTVLHVRGFDTNTTIRFYLLHLATKIIVLTNSAKEVLLGKKIHSNKIFVIPNGVKLSKKKYKKKFNAKFKFVYIGTYTYRKGSDVFFKLSKKLIENDNVEIHHFGKPKMDDTFTKLNEKLYLQVMDKTNFFEHGYIENFQMELEKYDALIFPSRKEGMPRSVLEAMSKGLVCFLSNIPEHEDLISDYETGILININDIDGAYKKIVTVINNKKQFLNISQNAINYVFENHNIKETNNKIIKLLVNDENFVNT